MAGAALPRCLLKVRAQCANRARWEFVRGVASNGHPYRENIAQRNRKAGGAQSSTAHPATISDFAGQIPCSPPGVQSRVPCSSKIIPCSFAEWAFRFIRNPAYFASVALVSTLRNSCTSARVSFGGLTETTSLVDFAFEHERHLIVVAFHRRSGICPDIEGLIPVQCQRHCVVLALFSNMHHCRHSRTNLIRSTTSSFFSSACLRQSFILPTRTSSFWTVVRSSEAGPSAAALIAL